MIRRHFLGGLVTASLVGRAAWGQFGQAKPKTFALGEAKTLYYRAGMTVSADTGPCQGLVGTLPVPRNWPEQEVRVAHEDVMPGARVDFREVAPTLKQMVIHVPYLPAGQELRGVFTYEIVRRKQLPPESVEGFKLLKQLNAEMRTYLNPSPGIDSRSAKIVGLVRLLGRSATPWEQAHAIYNWTRENIKYEAGPFKGVLDALRDGTGDVEDLAAVFIALCRAYNIPARTVWVYGSCYPEFHLVDAEDTGHWIPCLLTGEGSFGSMAEQQPILLKGDSFRLPENGRGMERFIPEKLTGKGGKPKVRFIREMVERPMD